MRQPIHRKTGAKKFVIRRWIQHRVPATQGASVAARASLSEMRVLITGSRELPVRQSHLLLARSNSNKHGKLNLLRVIYTDILCSPKMDILMHVTCHGCRQAS